MAEDVASAFQFPDPVARIGTLLNGEGSALAPAPGSTIALPLGTLNRHGMISGATGTGKTRTLQLLAEQLSASGVPVFLSDVKGDLTGLGVAGEANEKLTARTQANGQEWAPRAFPVDYYQLGGPAKEGDAPARIPIRATVSSFGPVLMSKVLGLNDTQSSVLSMVFHYADGAGLLLLDLIDLRALVQFLAGDEAKTVREELGGISTQSAGVILRAIIELSAAGGDRFFGEPETDIDDFLRTDDSGAGVISSLAVPELSSQPQVFSTFLMWLLAELYTDLPEVGDPEKPKLVFFFDEAHLLFADASKEFLDQVAQTVRLIRSKGVGVFFVTQRPTDVSEAVLSQLGTRVQHALRSHTPADAKAMKQVVSTFPKADFDLAETIGSLGTGQAVIAGLNPDGVPTPVARTAIWAPASLMSPAPEDAVAAAVTASPLTARYGITIDRESAHEKLVAKYGILADADDGTTDDKGVRQAPATKEAPPEQPPASPEAAPEGQAPAPETQESDYIPVPDLGQDEPRGSGGGRGRGRKAEKSGIEGFLSNPMVRDIGRTAVREITRGLFGTGRRRRR